MTSFDFTNLKFEFRDREPREKLFKHGHIPVLICFSSVEDGLKGLHHTINHQDDILAYFHGTKEEFLNVLDRVPGTLASYRHGYNLATEFHVKHLEDVERLPPDNPLGHKLHCKRIRKEKDEFVAGLCGKYIYTPQTKCSCGADKHRRWIPEFYIDHPGHEEPTQYIPILSEAETASLKNWWRKWFGNSR